jgi:hypothetical protein
LATIKHYKIDALDTESHDLYLDVDSVARWILDNISAGVAFHVFKGAPCADNSIPITPEDLASLGDGDYTVMETPAWGYVAFAVIAVVAAAYVVKLTPAPELPQNVSRIQESPNNALSNRQNTPRPLQRVPDICGLVRSTPDSMMPEWVEYIDNVGYENGYYCVGRDYIDVTDIRDGGAPIGEGSGAQVYDPFLTPFDDAPSKVIGQPFSQKLATPYRVNEVNGASLEEGDDRAVSVGRYEGVSTSVIRLERSDTGSWNNEWNVGSLIKAILTIPSFGGAQVVDAEVLGYGTSGALVDWIEIDGSDLLYLTAYVGSCSGSISTRVDGWANWAYLAANSVDDTKLNISAPNGLYEDDRSGSLKTIYQNIDFEIQQIDANGNQFGSISSGTFTIKGDQATPVFYTLTITHPTKLRFRVRLRAGIVSRPVGSVVQALIKWDDCYGLRYLDAGHNFGNKTTIQTRTVINASATAVKKRQINCLAQEMAKIYYTNSSSASRYPNRSAINSFLRLAYDDVVGGLNDFIDVDQAGLVNLAGEIQSYFNSSDQIRFDYTIDSTETSFQEIAQMILNAINCIGYREGGQIKGVFEKLDSDPTMLFTHRSKLPNSEKYTRSMNKSNQHDGVEFNWVNPDTNTTEVIRYNNGASFNPLTLNIAGIRTERQAIVRAKREWNKVRLQKLSMDVTVTAEGRYVLPNSVISVVKGSRVYTEDGEIIAQDGMQLTLSQDVILSAGVYSIILKHNDGTTEAITVASQQAPNVITLTALPTVEIRTGIDSRRTEFSYGEEARHLGQLWLAQEIDTSNKMQASIKAINYDAGYYAGDADVLNAYSSGYSSAYS